MNKRSVTAMPESVHVIEDHASGLSGVIVLHSTVLGPAAGGCRLWDYASQGDVTADAVRLAEGMSYKNALAGLPLGGGKAVIRRPQGAFDREALFRAFGHAVDRLSGQYVTAEDVGTSVEDMRIVAGQTPYVSGLPPRAGRPGGDPSPWTARGVFLAMELAALRQLKRPLSQCTVAIQGVGNVGAALALMLHEVGAKIIIADTNSERVARVANRTGAMVVSVSNIMKVNADILAPCALGGVLNANTIPQLSASVVCGAANNQLAVLEESDRLADRGVLYAPDYVVNAGGIINVAAEYLGWNRASVEERVNATACRLLHVLDHAESSGVSPARAADGLARAVLEGSMEMAAAA